MSVEIKFSQPSIDAIEEILYDIFSDFTITKVEEDKDFIYAIRR